MQPFKNAHDIAMRDKMIQRIEEEQQKIKQVLLDIYSNHKEQKDQAQQAQAQQANEYEKQAQAQQAHEKQAHENHEYEQHHLSVIADYNTYFEDELRLKQSQLEKILLLIEANDNLEIKDKFLLDEIKMDQVLLLKEIEKIDKEIKSLIKQISK
jgi:hypothetical protein